MRRNLSRISLVIAVTAMFLAISCQAFAAPAQMVPANVDYSTQATTPMTTPATTFYAVDRPASQIEQVIATSQNPIEAAIEKNEQKIEKKVKKYADDPWPQKKMKANETVARMITQLLDTGGAMAIETANYDENSEEPTTWGASPAGTNIKIPLSATQSHETQITLNSIYETTYGKEITGTSLTTPTSNVVHLIQKNADEPTTFASARVSPAGIVLNAGFRTNTTLTTQRT